MPKKQTRSSFLSVRLTPQERKAFGRKTESYGGPTFVIRELIQAFIEDRLTITQPKESLYVPRIQD